MRGIAFLDPDPNADPKTGIAVDGVPLTRNAGIFVTRVDFVDHLGGARHRLEIALIVYRRGVANRHAPDDETRDRQRNESAEDEQAAGPSHSDEQRGRCRPARRAEPKAMIRPPDVGTKSSKPTQSKA